MGLHFDDVFYMNFRVDFCYSWDQFGGHLSSIWESFGELFGQDEVSKPSWESLEGENCEK